MRYRKPNPKTRRGAVAVELAVLSPFIVMIFCGVVELGQFVNVAQSVSNASREGARLASRYETLAVSTVQTAVQNYMYEYGSIPPSAITVSVTKSDGSAVGASLAGVTSGSGVAVSVSVDFNAVRWTNLFNMFMSNRISNKSVMRRE